MIGSQQKEAAWPFCSALTSRALHGSPSPNRCRLERPSAVVRLGSRKRKGLPLSLPSCKNRIWFSGRRRRRQRLSWLDPRFAHYSFALGRANCSWIHRWTEHKPILLASKEAPVIVFESPWISFRSICVIFVQRRGRCQYPLVEISI